MMKAKLALCFLSLVISLALLALLTTVSCSVGSTSGSPGDVDLVTDPLPGLKLEGELVHYSGYLDAGNGVSLHYWFFQSQNSASDPLVLWLNGGPGCSSMLGALTELGPIRLNRDGTVKLNKYSWTKSAHILFLESPAGVGFSYNSSSDFRFANDDESTAESNHQALRSFYTKFPQFRQNRLFIAGESYGGIYVPMLAEKLIQDPDFKLEGMAIGNGYLDSRIIGNAQIHYKYYHGLLDRKLYRTVIAKCCEDVSDLPGCKILDSENKECQFMGQLAANQNLEGLNVYNINDKCYRPSTKPEVTEEDEKQEQCFDQAYLVEYLNKPEVKKALHVSEHARKWLPCRQVDYTRTMPETSRQVKMAVEKGVRVLIYAGDLDTICNFMGVQWFVERLGFKEEAEDLGLANGPEAWRVQEYGDIWQTAGLLTKYEKGLRFLIFHNAGHMVPTDRPRESLEMFQDFIKKVPKDM